MIVYKTGDVLNAGEEIVVHGCNCFKAMGAGIARQVRAECPEAYKADQATLWGDKTKLGTFTYGREEKGMIVVNAYTQYTYSRTEVVVDYNALAAVFVQICQNFEDHSVIAMPKIGCGLAGGDWGVVSLMLDAISDHFKKTFHVYELDTNEY